MNEPVRLHVLQHATFFLQTTILIVRPLDVESTQVFINLTYVFQQLSYWNVVRCQNIQHVTTGTNDRATVLQRLAT